jgi:predicted DNA-binding protein with PD1-like motif
MNVRESHRTRHLVIRLDRGDELPTALVRALDEAEARSGFITGVGTLEAAVLRQSDRSERRLDIHAEVVSLSGNVAVHGGATSIRLSAVLSRETETGLATSGGQLTWARALSLELHAVIFDDLALTRIDDADTGLPVLEARPVAPARPAPAAPAAGVPAPARSSPAAAEPPSPPPPPVAALKAQAAPPAPPAAHAPQAGNEAPALPQKPYKPKDDLESYPDVGDTVMHFHFGECTVIGSDGDRIRLRQDRDGRVREVALTMLRIEPATDAAEGPRHFKLHRKN